MNTIKAIETRYAGCRFRSRLEARWAVFFDKLGVRWEYEPQGFSLPSGPYLPDFWLPEFDAWWEVKGVEPELDSREDRLAEELTTETMQRVYTAWGPMPRGVDQSGHSDEDRRIDFVHYALTEEIGGFSSEAAALAGDIDYAFCACPWCGKIGVEYEGRSARVCGWRAHHDNYEAAELSVYLKGHHRADDKCYTADDPRILEAYTAARSARFEHGEQG